MKPFLIFTLAVVAGLSPVLSQVQPVVASGTARILGTIPDGTPPAPAPVVQSQLPTAYQAEPSPADPVTYTLGYHGWTHFDADRNLLGNASILPTSGPLLDWFQFFSTGFRPAGHSAKDVGVETPLGDYDDKAMNLVPHGMTADQDVVSILQYHDPLPYKWKGFVAVFPDGSGPPTLLNAPDDAEITPYHDPQGSKVTCNGWILAQTEVPSSNPSGGRLVLWNPSLTRVALPVTADRFFATCNLTDLPNGRVAVVANNPYDSVSRVFLPDAQGAMSESTGLTGKNIDLLAGDGTAMTRDGKLWRNGRLIPLRDLCEGYKDLEDDGYNLSGIKANQHGTYLIQATKPDGVIINQLLMKVEFKLRYTVNFDKGWDNTNRNTGPWTCCGVDRKKPHLGADGNPDGTSEPYPNSIIQLVIPGCTAALASRLEQVPAPGSETYLTLTNQTIAGELTLFDIQGAAATTTAAGCQIIVRGKLIPANRSAPLNVHVFDPRVVKFQVYRANPPAGPEPGFVASLEQIKTELNKTYNEQSNIRSEELQPDIVNVNNIEGVFNTNGTLTEENGASLSNKIREVNEAKHLRIIQVQSVVPAGANATDPTNKVIGTAKYSADWVIVEAGVSQLDTYSHETGHSFNLASRSPPQGQRHETSTVKAPNGEPPLMRNSNGTTRWIRQEDWKLSNTQAANQRYSD